VVGLRGKKKTSCVGQDKVSYSILQNQDIRQHIKAETLHEKFILHYSAKVFLSLQCAGIFSPEHGKRTNS
jgi:hypothetical protein